MCIESYPRPNSFRRFFASLYDLGSVLHSWNASAKSFTITEKAELLIHIMTSYEAALPQKGTLKIWNNHDKDDAWPLS
jgi:hypothetical protein